METQSENFALRIAASVGQITLSLGGGLWGRIIGMVSVFGNYLKFFGAVMQRFPMIVKNPSLTLDQVVRLGLDSLPLVLVISVFIGAVTTIQVDYQFRGLIPSTYLGTAICKFVIIESGPVLTALVLAGRLGSAIAAEVGTMKEKEELDAMTVLDLDPLRYLAMPRLMAAFIAFPCLVILADGLALFGGWLIARYRLDITTGTYFYGLRFLFQTYDIWVGLFKAVVFGGIVALTGFHQGLRAAAGAKGVGEAAMHAVVISCVSILIMDFIIVFILY